MINLLAIQGSPRRKGNTALLLKEAARGAREEGAAVEEIFLRDLRMAPCLEIYGCAKTGRCAILDDFQPLYDKLISCDGLMLASPVFFYTVSAQTKILMDRCQSFWVRKYWLTDPPLRPDAPKRKALFVSAGASKGRRLFEWSLLTVRYFLDVIDMTLWKALLYRGLDFEGDVLKFPEYTEEAYQSGREFFRVIASDSQAR